MSTMLAVFALLAFIAVAIWDTVCLYRKREELRRQKEDDRKRALLKTRLESVRARINNEVKEYN